MINVREHKNTFLSLSRYVAVQCMNCLKVMVTDLYLFDIAWGKQLAFFR